VLGGFVYRGSALDQTTYPGRYFYAVSSFVQPLLIAGVPGQLTNPAFDIELQVTLGMTVFDGPTSFVSPYVFAGFGEDWAGELYFIRLDASNSSSVVANGTIFKLIL